MTTETQPAPAEPAPQLTHEDVCYCDCAQCGLALLGTSQANVRLADSLGVSTHENGRVYLRVRGRPYCKACVNPISPHKAVRQ